MFPHERSLVKRMEGKPFALIGINSDTNKQTIQNETKKQQITWRSFSCGAEGTRGKIPRDFKVRGWPTLLLIDHNGIIRHRWTGNPGNKTLDAEIEKLVKQAENEQKRS